LSVLRKLGIRGIWDFYYFVLILEYAMAICGLMVGALACDFGLASFGSSSGRPVILDLTLVTAAAAVIITSLAVLWLVFAFISLRFKPRVINPDSVEIHSPTVSVLIPARDEEAVVRDLVDDLLDQEYPHLEVIVVAHNCSDRTFESLDGIADPRLKRYRLTTDGAGKALALNFGLARASGELIGQFDADNRIQDARLIRRAVAYFLVEENTQVIQSQIETKNQDMTLLTRLQAVEYRIFSHLFWAGRNAIGLPSPIAGTGVFFRKAVLTEVGGWDNELVEDYDLYCKLVLSKARIEYKPDLVVLDEKPPSWRLLIRQRSRWQRGHLEVLSKRWRTWMGLTDMMYLAAPIANGEWYASTIITILRYALPWTFTYWYPPAILWVSMWMTSYLLMALILVKTGHRRDVRYLPLFFIYGFHWLVAFLLAVQVKGWSSSKTPHGPTQ